MIGGGTMGSGIAAQAVVAGRDVTVVEVSDAAARQTVERVERLLDQAVAHGAERSAFGAVAARSGLDAVVAADLVIESVPEVVELKREVLHSASKIARRDAIFATNTSSIQVADLASSVQDPSRFGGLHFFNPVLPSQLIEVVVGGATSEATTDALVAAARGFGKEPIVVRDRPGFATSRLGVLLGLEAARMLEEEVASAEDIDRGMQLGYRHPVGPLRLSDLVGLDVRLQIARYLAVHLGSRFEPPQILIDKVARGELGRKSGRGFFEW
nr:3-hydroxyacyl-CoA dehydrogenase family protein [Acidimicrobium ferrooxidans]